MIGQVTVLPDGCTSETVKHAANGAIDTSVLIHKKGIKCDTLSRCKFCNKHPHWLQRLLGTGHLRLLVHKAQSVLLGG